jgi:hypothetical protein
MIQKVNVNYGFTQLEIPSLNIGYYVIKLKFNQSSVDDIMTKFFESLGFKYYQTISKKGITQIVFQYYTVTGNGQDRTINAQNYLTYNETCNKVREFLIRKKITGLYNQLSEIRPGVQIQPVSAPLEF